MACFSRRQPQESWCVFCDKHRVHRHGAESIATDEGMVADQDATIVVTAEESKSKLLEAYVGFQIDSTPLEEELVLLAQLPATETF